MNLFAEVKQEVDRALAALVADGALPRGIDTGNVTVEPPRDAAHGDMATNAAMVLAKPAGSRPRDLAEKIAGALRGTDRFAEVTVAGPGFINMALAAPEWHRIVAAALRAGADYGRSTAGQGRRVNVEFVSANPTGPLHVGHTRGAVFGDALASLLAFAGWEVVREYYVNDGGAQVDVLARSAYQRYREANGEAVDIHPGLYPGDYLVPVGRGLKETFGDTLMEVPDEEWLPKVRDYAIQAMMDLIREDLGALGVRMDEFFSERSLYGTGRIEATLADLESRELIYTGVLEPPKGKTIDDWEPRPQTLFRSTAHGDDVDRPIRKADGSWTYFAPDIAYHKDKVDRGFDLLIDVLGADHGGYVKRMKAAVSALSDGRVPLDIKLCQLVRLFKGGAEFKMSKRAGTFVTLRDVLDEVGPDVTRFTMLTRRNDAPLDFDFAKALEQAKENPVWYVQYANARTHSAFRKAAEEGVAPDPAGLADADLSALTDQGEIEIIRRIAEWPRQVETAAAAHEPHRITFYLYDLASAFNAHWNRGQDEPALRFIRADDAELTRARLALVMTVRVVISSGLAILGVAPMHEM
ncbi:MAG TPA: arginine--tRNA ligase [Paracoccaceae bacterium]|nr:arginine--tRNA ligase [Paracoccaceae bacterium]